MTSASRTTLVAILAATAAAPTSAQRSVPPSLAWQAVRNGPMGGRVTNLLQSSENVILARTDGGLYRSTDDGRTWVHCSRLSQSWSPRPPTPARELLWDAIAFSEPETQAPGGGSAQFRMTDGRCESFGFASLPSDTDRRVLEAASFHGPFGNLLFVSGLGVFRSPDAGRTWTKTLPLSPPSSEVCAVRGLLSDAPLFVKGGSQLYRSADNGASWALVPEDPKAAQAGVSASETNPGLTCPMVLSDNWWTLYAGGPGGLWRSTDQGLTWTRVFSGSVFTFTATERRVWVQRWPYDGGSLMRSEDEGATWTALPYLRDLGVTASRLVDTRRGTLLAATASGLFRSEDRGQSWARTGFDRWNLALAADSQRLYATSDSGLWTSADAGLTWSSRPWVGVLTRVFDTGDGRTRGVFSGRLLASDDGGTTWRSSGLDKDVLSLVKVGDTWYASTEAAVFRSKDLDSWTECSSGLGRAGPLLVTGKGDLFVASGARSIDGCRSWWPLVDPGHGPAGPLAFNTSSNGVVTMGAGIAHMDLTARTWSLWKEAGEITVTSAAQDRRGRYWIGTAHGVYALTLDGGNREIWPMGFDGERILSLTVDPKGYMLAAVDGRGLFRAALP